MMLDARLVALRLVFEAIEVAIDVTERSSRVLLHDAIYLVQSCGLDLGYQFFWSSHGPHSMDLMTDCFDLRTKMANPTFGKEQSLRPNASEVLAKVRELLAVPDGLNQSAWLGLLVRVHFFATRESHKHETLATRLAEENPDLVAYLDIAVQRLSSLHEIAVAV